MFRKVLIANRGEIAVRILRTLREMGITSVAIFSDVDRQALFVQEADEAYHVGPPSASESYLNIAAILSIAHQAKVDAIHPGYGFLAENADFATAVSAGGLTFIGPSPHAIRTMGDKVEARRLARRLGVPVVPGTSGPVTTLESALDFGRDSGYPIAVKASGGGGGRGIRVVNGPLEMADALERATREAEVYFKNPEVYLERYFQNPRHVEIQVLGDASGHVVHLGERDCSVQRRHQKLIEEAPSPAIDRPTRARLGDMAVRIAAAGQYASAGTVEFLVTGEGDCYFLEMNTRIQVEHPVTESVTGVDLIREMVLAAAAEPITVLENVVDPYGHAIEIRINAEDPVHGFRPTPTTIDGYREPGGIGIRMDTGVYSGYSIPQEYDSLMAKLISWGPDRDQARKRALRALGEFVIDGPSSTIPFARAVLQHPDFVAGEVRTGFLEEHLPALGTMMTEGAAPTTTLGSLDCVIRGEEREFEVEVNRKLFHVHVAELHPDRKERRRSTRTSGGSAVVHGNHIVSPMHGTVVSIKKQPGDTVTEGETVFIIEAMKMENEVAAHRSGRLKDLGVVVGDTVESGSQLAIIE